MGHGGLQLIRKRSDNQLSSAASKTETVPTGLAVFSESDFPTLKRGANKHCAYGAFRLRGWTKRVDDAVYEAGGRCGVRSWWTKRVDDAVDEAGGRLNRKPASAWLGRGRLRTLVVDQELRPELAVRKGNLGSDNKAETA